MKTFVLGYLVRWLLCFFSIDLWRAIPQWHHHHWRPMKVCINVCKKTNPKTNATWSQSNHQKVQKVRDLRPSNLGESWWQKSCTNVLRFHTFQDAVLQPTTVSRCIHFPPRIFVSTQCDVHFETSLNLAAGGMLLHLWKLKKGDFHSWPTSRRCLRKSTRKRPRRKEILNSGLFFGSPTFTGASRYQRKAMNKNWGMMYGSLLNEVLS